MSIKVRETILRLHYSSQTTILKRYLLGSFNHPSSMKVDIIHFIMICDGSESTNIPRTCKLEEA